jgi:predicted nucleic acid-binding protein
MKIAVTDACIFIDLIELKIISEFFNLDIELHTTVDVLNELYPDQKELLKAYASGNKLFIHNLEGKQIIEMENIPFPRGLSSEDRSVLYIASKLKTALVLSSDKLVRNFAEKLSLEYHGIFWIFDHLVKGKLISKEIAASKLKELIKMNKMYDSPKTKKEVEERIQKWTG